MNKGHQLGPYDDGKEKQPVVVPWDEGDGIEIHDEHDIALLNRNQARALQKWLNDHYGPIPDKITLPFAGGAPKIRATYKNWKGNVRQRVIQPHQLFFGVTEHHPDPQWLMEALDIEKSAMRSFALRDLYDVQEGPDEA